MNPQTNSANPFKQPTVSPAQAAQGRAMQAAHPAVQPFQVPQNYAQPAAKQFTTIPTNPNFTATPSAFTQPQPSPTQPLSAPPTPPPTPTAQPAMPTVAQPNQPSQPSPQPIPQIQPTTPQAIPNQQPIASAAAAPAPSLPPVVENPLSTQAALLFSELRDSLVIMKDGSFRAVVACQSINFDLMSEAEREGVEYSYQNFLNSLNFNTQILIRSQKVDIGPYIERLTIMRRNNDNMLLGVLMDDYLQFISVLAEEANIMDKSFFIVIPYYGSADMERAVEQTKNFFKAMSKSKGSTVTRINRDVYNKAIEELNNRVDTVISGLYQIGIQSVRLNTKELSELFYNFNNPDTAVREPLVDFSQLSTTYVKKGTK